MNIKVEEKKLNIKINQETKKIEVSIIDNSDKIDLNLTNYDDREVRNLIQENTEQIEELDNNKADRTEIKTKTSELINDSNFVSDSNYVHTDNNYTTVEKEKLSNLENYDDTEVRQLIEGKQPRGNYLTEETDPTVPSHVKSITQQNITNWNNKADISDIPDVSNFASKTELGSETAARENADIGLQEQIDAITSSSDVKDIVGTYIELQNYDTSTLGNDDIVKVLQDNTHNEAMTYYRWVILGGTGSWQYVGQEGPYYTKSETETLLNNKQDEITSSNKIDSDLVNDTNQTNKFVTQIEKTTWNTEIENLHEEDELLKRNLQTTTGSGEEVTLNKTTELDFVKPPLPRGNTKQNTTTGKNLLNTIDANTTITNGITYYREQGIYYLSGNNTKTDAVWILPNTQKTNLPEFEIGQTYTMSFDGDISDNIYIQLNAINTSTGTQYNLGSIRKTVPSATFTIDSNYLRSAQLFIGVQPKETNVNCNFSVQIEKGAATSYEPYTGGIPSPNPDYPQEIRNVTGNVEVTISNENNTESKTLPVSLGNIELCKIGNYQDYLYKSNGKWYKYNAINKLVLNGSENWGLQSINSYGIANFQKSQPIDTIAGQANLSFCDKFSPQTTLISVTKDIGYFLNTAKVLFIRFNSSIANTAATFKTWLSQHNVTLYYVLGEATSTEITDTTLISQLEEILKTLSYQGQTNITSNTIAMFDVEAYQDLKIILDEKYVKPSTGIPKTDLASTVQTSLGKADTAVQKDGGSATQTVSLSSGTGTTALGVKSKSTSSYISFSGANTWIGSIGVSSDKKPVFYNGAGYTLAYTTDIPTKTSDLTNDSGYITSYTETDPTVPSHVKNITQANITSWNNKSDFSGDYNDLSNKPTIPEELSDLSDDSTHRLVTDTEKTTWNNKANVSDIPKVFYGTSATGASTAAKVIVCEDFTASDLVAGTRLVVHFTNGNSYNGQATLNVNGTGAKNIYYNGTTTNARYMWVAGESVDFIYNGTQWATINGGLATTSYYGVTKLATGANSDSQALALTPRSLYYLANYSICPYYSASKTYAVGDKVRYTYYIYECTTAIDTPETWNADHWQQADPLQKQIDDLEARIKALENLS